MTVDAAPKPHPWNRDFEWTRHHPPFQRVTSEQAQQFDEQGFFVLENAFGVDAIAAIRDEIDDFEAKSEAFLRTVDGQRISIAEAGAITFTTHLVQQSESLKAFSRDAVFAGLCADLVGPDVNLYWDQAVYKKPEKPRRFPWHQDNGYKFVEPQQYLTCWVALTDATTDNGCPQVVPGRHLSGSSASPTPKAWSRHPWARAASLCSRRSRRTSPARTRRTRSARPTSSSTRRWARRSSRGIHGTSPLHEFQPMNPPGSSRWSARASASRRTDRWLVAAWPLVWPRAPARRYRPGRPKLGGIT
jgi:hypothetical protein